MRCTSELNPELLGGGGGGGVLSKKPALGSNLCLPRRKNPHRHPLPSQRNTRFKCKPQASLLEEDGVMCPPPPPPPVPRCPRLFLSFALWSIMYSPGAEPSFILLYPPAERHRMKLWLSAGSNCIKGSPGQPWRTLQRGGRGHEGRQQRHDASNSALQIIIFAFAEMFFSFWSNYFLQIIEHLNIWGFFLS